MRQVFADTSFYVALLSPRDHLRAPALAFAQELTDTLVTTEYVLVEVANWLSSSGDRRMFSPFLNGLHANPRTLIIPNGPELFESGVDLYNRRPDKVWSLTDCISFVVMEQHGLTEVLTADHHFEQAGFKMML